MDISGKAGTMPPAQDRKDGSFAETLRKQDAPGKGPQPAMASAKSFRAGDLAAGYSWVSPDFIPAAGEGMLDAVALGEGVTAEMQRYEEKTKYR